MLGRTMHGIDYDEIHDEIVVPQQFGQAILVFKGSTRGEAPPIQRRKDVESGPVNLSLIRRVSEKPDTVPAALRVGDGSPLSHA